MRTYFIMANIFEPNLFFLARLPSCQYALTSPLGLTPELAHGHMC